MAKGFGKGRKPKRHKNRNIIKTIGFLMFSFIILSGVFTLYSLDKRIMPAILAATDMNTKTRVNGAINDALNSRIDTLNLTSDDFYVKSEDTEGKINSLAVNTVLINQLCNEIAVDISGRLNLMESERISLPIGSVLGINAFASMGPKYTITVLPMGDALVDYETSFESVGINQINFQIWLNIESRIQVINPLQNTEVTVTRKVSLVNTVINGEVPPTYFNAAPRLEY